MAKSRIKHGGKVFRDPIHRLIRIDPDDEFVLDLIDTPEFQRLRRIRQLGVSWLTFHGAEHSRFVHSLGVFNFAQRIIEVLCRRYAGHDVGKYLKEQAKVVKAAALLHDIGHGPFSHMIERAFAASGQHERKTSELIRGDDSPIGRVLRNHEIDADSVASLIDHSSEHPLLMDIVSSQLDADRMDYLLRDSYCTGVQYGLYDADWILNAFCVGVDESGTDGAAKPWRLCLDKRRGEKAAEQFVLARAHMNEQVYFHRVTRGYEAMLLALFAEAGEIAAKNDLPIDTPPLVVKFLRERGRLEGEDWIRFDESQLLVAMHSWAGSKHPQHHGLARWSRAFLNRERILASVALNSKATLLSLQLFAKLESSGLRQGVDWMADEAGSAVYKGILYSAAKKPDDEESRLESIFLASGQPDDPAKPIEVSSELVESLDRQKQSVIRLFFDKASLGKAQKILAELKLSVDSSGDGA